MGRGVAKVGLNRKLLENSFAKYCATTGIFDLYGAVVACL